MSKLFTASKAPKKGQSGIKQCKLDLSEIQSQIKPNKLFSGDLPGGQRASITKSVAVTIEDNPGLGCSTSPNVP